jgi:hypothetical protein
LAAAAADGAALGAAAGGVVAAGFAAAGGAAVGEAGVADEHALTNNVPAASRPLRRRTSKRGLMRATVLDLVQ